MSCPFSFSDQVRLQHNICETPTAQAIKKLLSWFEGIDAVGNVRTTTNGSIDGLDPVTG